MHDYAAPRRRGPGHRGGHYHRGLARRPRPWSDLEGMGLSLYRPKTSCRAERAGAVPKRAEPARPVGRSNHGRL